MRGYGAKEAKDKKDIIVIGFNADNRRLLCQLVSYTSA